MPHTFRAGIRQFWVQPKSQPALPLACPLYRPEPLLQSDRRRRRVVDAEDRQRQRVTPIQVQAAFAKLDAPLLGHVSERSTEWIHFDCGPESSGPRSIPRW